MKRNKNGADIFHLSFEIALILKAANALFETLCGTLLIFLSSDALNKAVVFLTQGELQEDPKDFIANTLIHMSQGFSIDARNFGIFYLLTHGVAKLILVILLWKKKLWAYPLMIILLILFIAYQAYRYAITQSVTMVLLTVLDAVVVILTLIEFKRQKAGEIQ